MDQGYFILALDLAPDVTKQSNYMRATILDCREDDNGKCFFCKISLEDYIKGLPSTYQDYDIQREIVTNVYLDHLVDTVLSRQHIPPIVLILENGKFEQKDNELHIETFKILDGLQRTFRLQAIRSTLEFCIKNLNDTEDYLSWSKFKLSRTYSTDLRELNSNTDVLRSILIFRRDKGKDALLDAFRLNNQWFEVWSGLSDVDEVKKMLTLNAGHKPVSSRHQLELLFLNLLPRLRAYNPTGFHLLREKDIGAAQFSKVRECGSFHFAHVITSLLSFYEGKPVATTTGLIQSIQTRETGIEEYNDFTSPEFLEKFVAFLVRLDKLLDQQYPGIGVFWMGREISLAGIFGALGAYVSQNKESPQGVMAKFLNLVETNTKILDLADFEAQRNNLDLSKVNIGNANRDAVFSAIKELLESSAPKKVDWPKHFRMEGR